MQIEETSSKSSQANYGSDRYFSRSIGNALRVLELLQESRVPLSLAEISRQTRLPKSSTFRILRTLEIASYIQRVDGDRFCVMPGSGFSLNRKMKKVVEVSQPWMKHLNQEFRETITLACLLDNHIEVAAVIDSPQRVSMGNAIGNLIPPHASSLGKCIAAYQPTAQRERLLRSFSLVRFTPNTIVEEVALGKHLDLVRTLGYATDNEESAPGGCCVGAPIFSGDAKVVAAISISVPTTRFTHQEMRIAAVQDTAKIISEELRSKL